MKRIVIDKDKCIGCFKCKQVCYSCFEVGNDAKAKVRCGKEYDVEEARTAEICCPTGAISIGEDSSLLGDDDSEYTSSSLLDTVLSVLDDVKDI